MGTVSTIERTGGLAPVGSRELIVMISPGPSMPFLDAAPSVSSVNEFVQLTNSLEKYGHALRPIFRESQDYPPSAEFHATTRYGGAAFFRVEASDDALESALKEVNQHRIVTAAYIKPPSTVPSLNQMSPSGPPAPSPATPDFRPLQGYLQPAPGGIDAVFAWTQPGGRGGGVRIIDLEWGWLLTHEDLAHNSLGLMFGPNHSLKDHGTAVLGEMGGDDNPIGVTGICPDAQIGVGSFDLGPTSSAVIFEAAKRLRVGDILLLEIHRPGPRFNFTSRNDQRGYIGIEWWPDDFAAIRAAVARGIIVVEAAGNGAENLDDPIYDKRPSGFPADWTNPFNRANRDSGAIIVGAGAPPSGTHGPDRSRLDFSNYGLAVDAQGWGREVVTTGYGDLQGGPDVNRFYTREFAGTSSASPIIVGTLACLQGIMRTNGSQLTPNMARRVLRVTGSPQQASSTAPLNQRIGNRPDLRSAIQFIKDGSLGPSESPV